MFLADSKAIINTQGLRWVVKSDKSYGSEADLEYYIEIQYKGSTKIIPYKSKEARDTMFDNLSVALTQPPARKPVG